MLQKYVNDLKALYKEKDPDILDEDLNMVLNHNIELIKKGFDNRINPTIIYNAIVNKQNVEIA